MDVAAREVVEAFEQRLTPRSVHRAALVAPIKQDGAVDGSEIGEDNYRPIRVLRTSAEGRQNQHSVRGVDTIGRME